MSEYCDVEPWPRFGSVKGYLPVDPTNACSDCYKLVTDDARR